jgi:hypothetical protein
LRIYEKWTEKVQKNQFDYKKGNSFETLNRDILGRKRYVCTYQDLQTLDKKR